MWVVRVVFNNAFTAIPIVLHYFALFCKSVLEWKRAYVQRTFFIASFIRHFATTLCMGGLIQRTQA